MDRIKRIKQIKDEIINLQTELTILEQEEKENRVVDLITDEWGGAGPDCVFALSLNRAI